MRCSKCQEEISEGLSSDVYPEAVCCSLVCLEAYVDVDDPQHPPFVVVDR